jgi:hypothetical protein
MVLYDPGMVRATAALLLTIFSATTLYGQTTASSEQRRWVVETTRWLEQNPLDPDAKNRATELLKWWTEVPDLTLSVCPLLIETRNNKVSPVAVSQAILSSGAYLIEHTDATRTELALAGVEGALRAYSNAVAANANMRDRFLDRLVAAQREGKLLDRYVRAAVAKCERSQRGK